MVKDITAITKPYQDGQRVVALAVQYDETFQTGELQADAFEVEDRNVISVSADGNVVTISLDPKDPKASTITNNKGLHVGEMKKMPEHGPGGHGPGGPEGDRGPGGPGGHGPGGPGGHGGPPETVLPDGRVFKGPAGLAGVRNPLAIKVKQVAAIKAADGSEVPAWDEAKISNLEENEWADLFEVRQFEDIRYNIYVPENYDPSVKYPLVMFIHDAGASGQNPRITLEQGIGATIFASPEEQKKHPCIVVAPQHEKFFPIANDNYWCFEDEHTIKRMLDQVRSEYNVDENRIYTTGQSMGFMTSVQLMLDYPGYFTAALLPAGHWDIEKTATLWNNKIWMFLSEDDGGGKGMIAKLPDAIKAIGGRLGVYTMDADQPTAELSKQVAEMAKDDYKFRITVIPTGTINRPGQPDRTDGGGHTGTWHLVYMIESARDWLFAQTKAE